MTGHEKVTGTPLTEADLERITGAVYHQVNDVQRARVDFLRPDGSYWGSPQGWVATPLPEPEAARPRKREERRRRRREFLHALFRR